MAIFHHKKTDAEKTVSSVQREPLPDFLREDGAQDWLHGEVESEQEQDFCEEDKRTPETSAAPPHGPGAVKLSPDVVVEEEGAFDADEPEEAFPQPDSAESVPWVLPFPAPTQPDFLPEEAKSQPIVPNIESGKKPVFRSPLIPLLLITLLLLVGASAISYFTGEKETIDQPESAWVQMLYEQNKAIYERDDTGGFLYTFPNGAEQVQAYFASEGYSEANELQANGTTLIFSKGNSLMVAELDEAAAEGSWPYEIWKIRRKSLM